MALPLLLPAQQPFLFGTYTLNWGFGVEYLTFEGSRFEYSGHDCTHGWQGSGEWEIRENRLLLHFTTQPPETHTNTVKIISQKVNSLNFKLHLQALYPDGEPIFGAAVKFPSLHTGFFTDEDGKGKISSSPLTDNTEMMVQVPGADEVTFTFKPGFEYEVEVILDASFEDEVIPGGETWIYRIEKSGLAYLLLTKEGDDDSESEWWQK